MNDVMRLIKDVGLIILNQQFDNDCTIQVSIRKMQVNMVLDKLHKVIGVKVRYDHSI
jgi:hypothetical protein